MRTELFFILFSKFYIQYVYSLIIVLLLFLPLIKKYTITVLSPEFINFIFLAFADSIPVFLFYIKKIDIDLFIYFLCFETAFILGLCIFKSNRLINKQSEKIDDENLSHLLFYLFFAIWITISFINFKNEGFGINKLYRLENNSNITGPLTRFKDFASNYLLIFSIHCIFNKKYKKRSVFIILLISVSYILSGGKSGILNVIYFSYLYMVYYLHNIKAIKKLKKYLPVIIISPIVIYLVNGLSFGVALHNFLFRFIAYGDPYWLSLPNRTITKIHYDYKFFQLFAGFLSPTKLFPNYLFEDYLGIKLNSILYPNITHISGANARPPIFYYALFNWYGIICGFILGVIISYVVFRLHKKMCKSFILSVIYFEIFIQSLLAIIDPNAALSSLFSLLLNFIVICCFSLLMGKYKFKIVKN